jgi:hypothetical protein
LKLWFNRFDNLHRRLFNKYITSRNN